MAANGIYAAVDLGAGLGAKIGIFNSSFEQQAESLLPCNEYGSTGENLADALIDRINDAIGTSGNTKSDLKSIGIASAGILRSDGTFHLTENLKHLIGFNLPKALEAKTKIPSGIENDANAGGMAEWSVLGYELLYWVLGGGWGGAWISKSGEVRFPTVDWDGNDSSLHYTNEPGFGIPLEKAMLRTLFNQVNGSFERFEKLLVEEFNPEGGVMRGPAGSEEHLRAEMLLSGPGRCRLFRAIVGDDDFYERFLDIHETTRMNDPAVAGKLISKLSSMRVEAAVQTDRLFGKILAEATRIMIRQARADGMPDGIPICLGGKPSYALPYFGPSAQRALGRMGIMSYLRPSVIDERGGNANLLGAAVLAHKTWEKNT